MNFHYRNSDMLNVYLLLALNPVVRELIPLLLQEWVEAGTFWSLPNTDGLWAQFCSSPGKFTEHFHQQNVGFLFKGLWPVVFGEFEWGVYKTQCFADNFRLHNLLSESSSTIYWSPAMCQVCWWMQKGLSQLTHFQNQYLICGFLPNPQTFKSQLRYHLYREAFPSAISKTNP